MALEFGFYDSINGDRRYNAIQMSEIFEGIVNDGVYASVGETFATYATSGMNVSVGTGRAWFHNTWNRNRARIPLEIEQADPAFDRIDSVVLVVNSEDTVRSNDIRIVKGNVAVNPEPPILSSGIGGKIYYMRLSNIRVRAGTTSVTAADITITVGTSETPFVTSIIQQTNIDVLFAKWDKEFNDWWDGIKAVLDDNIATNLQNQIDALGKRVDASSDVVGDIRFSSSNSPAWPGTWEAIDGRKKQFSTINSDVVLKNLGIKTLEDFEVKGSLKFNSIDTSIDSAMVNSFGYVFTELSGYSNQYLLFLSYPSVGLSTLFHVDMNNGCAITTIENIDSSTITRKENFLIFPIGTTYTVYTYSVTLGSNSTVVGCIFKLLRNSDRVIVRELSTSGFTFPMNPRNSVLGYYKASPTQTIFYMNGENIILYRFTVGDGNSLFFEKYNSIGYRGMYVDSQYIYINRDNAPYTFRIKIGTTNVLSAGANSNGNYYFSIPYVKGSQSIVYSVTDEKSLYCFQLGFISHPHPTLANTTKSTKIHTLNCTLFSLDTQERQFYGSNYANYIPGLSNSYGKKINLILPDDFQYGENKGTGVGRLLYTDYGIYFFLFNNESFYTTNKFEGMELLGWKLPTYEEAEKYNEILNLKPFTISPTIRYNNKNIPLINWLSNFDSFPIIDFSNTNLQAVLPLFPIYNDVCKTKSIVFPGYLARTGSGKYVFIIGAETCRTKQIENGFMKIS